jgi:hypothetical protein
MAKCVNQLVYAAAISILAIALFLSTLASGISTANAKILIDSWGAMISAHDNQGNTYRSWYDSTDFCISGYEFLAQKIDINGFVTRNSMCEPKPCTLIQHSITRNNTISFSPEFSPVSKFEYC